MSAQLGEPALQREILAVLDDKDALRKIATREGIDASLWDSWIALTKEMHALAEGMKKALQAASNDGEDAQTARSGSN